MAQQFLENGKSWGLNRGIINANFTEVWSIKLEASQVLIRTNTTIFVPTQDYHPCTKLYADELKTNWDTVFNPQDITGDVFLRSNHTGDLPPSVIAQDSTNRLVTDAQITSWDNKEDSIGAHETGFNLPIGTTVNTVAAGDHTHTKADVGLASADDTSDVDKPVSTAQQAALDLKADTTDVDLKLDKALADFTPQSSDPAHVEGRVWFDANKHTLNIYNDISDVTLNVGEEMYMRVINKSGSTITNGSVCRHDGVDVTTQRPKIALALADTIANASILGVATHDIGNDAQGFITTNGEVNDIDTGSLPEGQPLYLSDVTPGALVSVPPDIASQVGGSLKSDAVNGILMVNLRSTIALPSLLGILQDAPDTYTLSSTYQDVDNYQLSDSLGMTVTPLTGHLVAPGTGWYRISINLTATVTAAAPGGDAILFRLWNNTQSTASSSTTLIITSSNLTGSRSATGLFLATSGDDLVLQIASDDSTADLDFDSIAFDIESVNIK